MRYFLVSRADEEEIISEEEILATYFPSWKAMKMKNSRDPNIDENSLSEEDCLEEWCNMNRATEVQYIG